MPPVSKVATLAPDKAADRLSAALRGFRGDLTVADASARGGLALREAEAGLHQLVVRHQGHLAATDKGELLFRFPGGLRPPPAQRPWRRFLRRIGRGVLGIGRFFVRAWVSVVMIAYAAIFAVILIALATRDRDDGDGMGGALEVLLRVVLEAVYWTFHPFSPYWMTVEPGWIRGRRSRPARGLPFYEKVNRFVFGPVEPPVDETRQRQQLYAEIRRLGGRIGIADVMRVTGLPRGQADALLSKVLLDLEGDVQVTDEGAIVYAFTSARLTAVGSERNPPTAPPIWTQPVPTPELTGNPAGSNVLITGINGFNLAASGWALSHGLTIERLMWELERLRAGTDTEAFPVGLPPEGTAVVLGAVPFVFSATMFALPLLRALGMKRRRAAAERERGRRAVMRTVLGAAAATTLGAAALTSVFQSAAGRAPVGHELDDIVRELGGDLRVEDDGRVVYHFEELVREQAALAALRRSADQGEANPGRVIFSSDS